VPSPVTGELVEICVKEGLVAQIGQIVAYIETDEPVEISAPSTEAPVQEKSETVSVETPKKAITTIQANGTNNGVFSPLVRNIAKVEGVSNDELKRIQGSGLNDRVTKKDILSYVDMRKSGAVASSTPQPVPTAQIVDGNFPHKIDPIVVNYDPNKVEVIKMSTMRKGIAKHMVQSLYTAPHVFSIHEVNMKKIWDWRNGVKGAFKAKHGFNLTFTHIIMDIVARCIQKHPRINSSIQGDHIIVHREINLGMAVGYTAKDGDNGLIVPVIRNCEEINLLGLARRANDVTHKARNLALSIDETKGGTFTVTNVGVFGTEVGLGIINQPQVAILALGTIVKKPIITADDAIAVAPMMKISMSYDHRVVDGMLAGQFLQMLQEELENFDGDQSIL
jgi:2-oxoglutarate dehydrogenase E2 component (dihydrolipoamide succinyltransferase)